MSLIQKLSTIGDFANYTNISKLIVFRFTSLNGNLCNENYDGVNLLGSDDLEKITMDVSKVEIVNGDENTPTSYLLYDANSDGIYTIAFYAIPETYSMNIMNIDNNNILVIYQTYLTA